MPAEINLFDIYRSPNIGIFLRANDKFCLVPRGLASTKSQKIESFLRSKALQISVAGSRLIGPLIVMNNNGIIVSRLAEDEEVDTLKRMTDMKVEKLNSRFTSVGNLIAANDNGALVSDVFGEESVRTIQRVLDAPVRKMRISNYVQLGSMVCATNGGAITHPSTTESEMKEISETLRVDPEPATVNGGIPFVGSGFVGNTKGILLGNSTRGSELVIIGRAFSS